MGHTAPLPSSDDIKRVNKWADKLCLMLSTPPAELGLEFTHSRNEDGDVEHYPLHAFSARHHTLPARELVIGFGLPTHGLECECIVPSRPRLTISVWDEDTGDEIAESGRLQIDDPRNWATVIAAIMMTAASFSQLGTI